jgi:methionine sulfoxide reductase heme-binding subunit
VTTLAAGALDGRALWYLSRGTGAVSLVLLTAAVVLGIVDLRRWSTPGVPRFVVDGLHRTVALVAVLMLAVHVATSVLDPFAPIRLVDAVVPFGAGYRPVWLGLGALALDLLVAIVLTSLLRARLGYGGWRAVHWLAYACWPVALVHGLGTGSDVRGGFLLPLSVACAVAVAVAVAIRLAPRAPGRVSWRVGGLGALVAAGAALVLWLPSGPLARGWAARAGTPAAASTATPTAAVPRPSANALPFGRATVHGSISQVVRPDGSASVDLALGIGRGSSRRLAVALEGTALAGGGVTLTQGQVTLGRYRGPVSSLQGSQLEATLTAPDAPSVELSLSLSIDRASGSVDGVASLHRTVGA